MGFVLGDKMTTAVFIDGAFFIKKVRSSMDKSEHYHAQKFAGIAFSMAMAHLSLHHKQNKAIDELYRIFFYDCPPLTKKHHLPISQKSIDFAKSSEAIFRQALHQELRKKRKCALRLGRLSDMHSNWRIKPSVQKELLANKRLWSDLTDDDFALDIIQKGVDMRIGTDIATVSLKKQANRIVLVAGDADFVPAAKLARREGVDFILDPMRQKIPDDLFEHIDGLHTTFKPSKTKTPTKK